MPDADVPDDDVSEGEGVERVLVVTAHPDDVDFGAAGSVAAWTDAGAQVTYCIVTDGDAGGFDPAVPRAEIPAIRRAEQTSAAAAAVGVAYVVFLGRRDGYLEVSLELRREIAAVIRRVRPQRVVTQSPERNWDRIYPSHPDHLAAGEATICAVYPDSRNPFWFPELVDEGLEPWTVEELWVMGGPQPNRFVDVTEQFERKLDALRCHVSQHTDADGGLEARMRGWLGFNAEAGGLEPGRLAEAFRVLDVR